MRRIVLCAALVGLAVVLVTTLYPRELEAQKKGAWKEVEVGEIPTKFGDIVAFTGAPNNYALLFKDDSGVLRLVEFRGSKVNPRAFKIKRAYDD